MWLQEVTFFLFDDDERKPADAVQHMGSSHSDKICGAVGGARIKISRQRGRNKVRVGRARQQRNAAYFGLRVLGRM